MSDTIVTVELLKLLGLSFGMTIGLVKTLEYMRYASDGYNSEQKRRIENMVNDKIYAMENKIADNVVKRLNTSKVTFQES